MAKQVTKAAPAKKAAAPAKKAPTKSGYGQKQYSDDSTKVRGAMNAINGLGVNQSDLSMLGGKKRDILDASRDTVSAATKRMMNYDKNKKKK